MCSRLAIYSSCIKLGPVWFTWWSADWHAALGGSNSEHHRCDSSFHGTTRPASSESQSEKQWYVTR